MEGRRVKPAAHMRCGDGRCVSRGRCKFPAIHEASSGGFWTALVGLSSAEWRPQVLAPTNIFQHG